MATCIITGDRRSIKMISGYSHGVRLYVYHWYSAAPRLFAYLDIAHKFLQQLKFFS